MKNSIYEPEIIPQYNAVLIYLFIFSIKQNQGGISKKKLLYTEANITLGALSEAYSIRFNSPHSRTHISMKAFVIAAFESNNRITTY